MAGTYEPLGTTTLSSDTSTITFTSISGNYTDLILVIQGRTDATTTNRDVYLQYNSDTGTNYSSCRMYADGSGSSKSSDVLTNWSSIWNGYWYGTGSDDRSTSITQIMNYSNTTTYKTSISRQYNVGHNSIWHSVGAWRNTSAITRIDLSLSSASNFKSGSTFTLYGIKAL